MTSMLEVEKNGQIHLSQEVHGWKPHTRVQWIQKGKRLLLEPAGNTDSAVASAKEWAAHTPEERARAFRDLINTLRPRQGPDIPDDALRRENMYD